MKGISNLESRIQSRIAAILWLLAVALSSGSAAGQQAIVAGTVVDEQGAPVANAQVYVEETGTGTLTNSQGAFRLAVSSGEITIRVVILGFRTETRTVTAPAEGVSVSLVTAAINLDALVVTGTAGAVERRAVGTAIATINASDQVGLAPTPDVSQLINGRAPGVVVTPGTGMVGSGPTIRIRGASSFSLNTQPLIYVDGVRLDNGVGTGISIQGFGSGVVNRLNDVNPEDIESIEIIKGPAAATLYGTEASNGVIQILTKKGRSGAPEWGVTIRQGANWFHNAETRIEPNWGLDPVTGEPFQHNLFESERALGNTIFDTGHLQSYGINVRGGTDDVRYYLGADLERNEGIEPTNHLWRLTTRSNLTLSTDPRYDLTASIGYNQGRTNLACEAGCGGRMWATMFALPANRDNRFRGFISYPPEVISEAFDFWQDTERFTLSVSANHRPTSWLSHRLNLGQDRVFEDNVQLWERMAPEIALFFGANTARGGKFVQSRDVENTTFDYSATASFDLTNSIRSATTAGAQYYRRFTEFLVTEGNNFPAPGLTVVDALAQTFGGEDFVENSTVGLFVQERIEIGDRLFLTGAVRGDDNSAFGKDFDFVVYPKASISWVLSDEDFFSLPGVSEFKLRSAFGMSGQQPADYAALRTFAPVTGGGGIAAVTPQFIGNDALEPEKGSEVEIGFDAGLFDSRLGIDFTYYNTRTRDAILSRNLPPSLGFPGSQFVNAGEIRNQGFEVQLNAAAYQSGDISVDLSLNIATNHNEIIDLGGIDQGTGFIAAGSQRRVPGFPVASWFRRKVVSATLVGTGPTARTTDPMCDGGDPNGKTLPDGTPLELGGAPVPCAIAPRLYLGHVTPDMEGSLGTTLTLFNQVRLYVMVDWKTGYTKFDNNLRARCQVFNQCHENFFPEQYDPALIAEIQSGSPLRSFIFSDGSFAKLREVSASMDLPEQLLGPIGASRATLTLTGRNLMTWTNYTGLDPEASFVEFGYTLLEQDNTPQLNQFTATLNLSF